jgi:hypothetical protein
MQKKKRVPVVGNPLKKVLRNAAIVAKSLFCYSPSTDTWATADITPPARVM